MNHDIVTRERERKNKCLYYCMSKLYILDTQCHYCFIVNHNKVCFHFLFSDLLLRVHLFFESNHCVTDAPDVAQKSLGVYTFVKCLNFKSQQKFRTITRRSYVFFNSSETPSLILTKLWWNVLMIVLFTICVGFCRAPFNMAPMANIV